MGYRSIVSVLALVLLPKCALCVFAIGSAISVCGLDRVSTPFWEYLLILGLSLLPLIYLRGGECHQKDHQVGIVCGLLGAVLIIFSITGRTFHAASYYTGVSVLAAGQWVPGLARKHFTHRKHS